MGAYVFRRWPKSAQKSKRRGAVIISQEIIKIVTYRDLRFRRNKINRILVLGLRTTVT